MTTRRAFLSTIPVAGAAIASSKLPLASGEAQAQGAPNAQGELSWRSPSLTNETATGPNGATTTRVALDVNRRGGVPEPGVKIADEIVKGVYHLRGWGIAHSIAIDAPHGWIIVDTGDSTRAAAEKRELLEKTVGKKIKVAAILFTHWHYADGTDAWLDEGTELWGHEFLDSNRKTTTGVSVLRGNFLARATAIAMMPFNLTVFFAAMLIVKFYTRLTPRQIGRYGFILCTIALLWLAYVVRNDWSAGPVLIGLVLFGIGQGALVTLLFNVLVTASPKELAGDVGSLRGTTNNLAAALGTAVAGALLVGLLSSIMLAAINASPKLTPELQAQVDLDSINFISNENLQATLAKTTETPAQVAEAVRVNTASRLRALKIGLLIMAGVALLAIFPTGSLPNYRPGEIPDPSPGGRRKDEK